LYFCRLEQALDDFQGLVYPQNDPDAVTITQKDIRILDPSEFLNDTIIDFYIK
jgi:sentrin-specific protease 7